jgi:predicted GNAT family acetyltransferase
VSPIEIRHDEEQGRFVAEMDGDEAYMTYSRIDERTVDFRHTFVPRVLRGRKLAERLVREAFRWAEAEGYGVIPTCSYVRRLSEADPTLEALTTR